MKGYVAVLAVLFVALCMVDAAHADPCVECHLKQTPNIVGDWKLSAHAQNAVTCATCHGDGHASAQDVDKVKLATPDTCAECHADRVTEFKKGKHALGWVSVNAMPTTHWQPMTLKEGLKGCTGCHKIGLKSEDTIKSLRAAGSGFGVASCDACHTRHTFSKKEASQPQACRTCHMGMDHPQWEMYESSKHGVRHQLKQTGVLPESAAAPTCQTCHMDGGNHEVRAAWGFLAVRLPMPSGSEANKKWAEDRATVLMGLGVLSPEGQPTERLDVIKAADVARLSEESFQAERAKMVAICSRCHSGNFARAELAKGDDMIREADALMAGSIRTVAALYRDGVLQKPESYPYAYPDLLAFHDAPTEIEIDLWLMFLKHRMRTFQGSFHANPDYALWYGWSEMLRDATIINEKAGVLRTKATK